MRLLERLADDKPVVSNTRNDEPKITIMRREEVSRDRDSMKHREREYKEVVRTVVHKIPEYILRRTMLRRKKVSLKEEVEVLGLGQQYGGRPQQERDGEEENLSGESEEKDKDSAESDGQQDNLSMILAEEKRRYHDRELQTDSSVGTYNLEHHDANRANGREELDVSRRTVKKGVIM